MASPHIITMDTETSSNIEEFHKLSHKWTLWAHLPHDTDWTINSYKKVYTTETVEETIAVIETLPDILVKNCMLFFMRDGVKPTWEDPLNRDGGCFSYKVSNKSVCEVWRELSYSMVGQTLSKQNGFVNCVTGITISPKKNFCVIKIWMSTCANQNPGVVSMDIKNLSPQGCLFKKHTPEY